VLAPVAVAGLVTVWAVARFNQWRADRAREQASIEQAERERQSAGA
jgi:hypothetical protein